MVVVKAVRCAKIITIRKDVNLPAFRKEINTLSGWDCLSINRLLDNVPNF